MTGERLHAYIDEAGVRSASAKSSDHFVMSAVTFSQADAPRAVALLAQLRQDLGRRPSDHLTWKNIKSHSERLHIAQVLGSHPWLTISNVVVCKRHLGGSLPSEDHAYLFTLRFLLERLSWFARDRGDVLTYTLAHITRFSTAKLRSYEAALVGYPGCQIAWAALDPHGGYIDQPQRLEQLQLADLAASATFRGFEPDRFGNTEPRYAQALAPRLYRRPPGSVWSYGMKMHPWSATTKAAYPWVAAL